MMDNFYSNFGVGVPGWIPAFGLMFVLLMLWSIFWKGLALWHSARQKQHWWFIVLLVVNTAGILEIIYLFLFLKIKASDLFNKKI